MINLRNVCLFLFPTLGGLLACCGGMGKGDVPKTGETVQKAAVATPSFNADSAYRYVEEQVAFGPRTPDSDAHHACGDWLVAQLEAFGAVVTEQCDKVTAFDGKQLPMRNIIGAFQPDNRKRILLCAHWDCRPWADNDPDKKNHHTPVDGANDGASGVGVLLEVARQIQQTQPSIGVDIIFFDVEDYGVPQFLPEVDSEGSWCLGSQYWASSPHVPDYNARFGILLDMVGGKDATFFYEGFSKHYAPAIADKVWEKAHQSGFGQYFPKQAGGYVTDDHLPINRIARIPCIDIIPMMVDCELSSFGDTWHTVNDNMEHIDRNTLKAVGQTVLEVIYSEK
ncbi:MAG: M28 family peptidase [Bacteroidaceae bacterium]|nr:M28 family peptidase [Bacteroidaceae bacterium]